MRRLIAAAACAAMMALGAQTASAQELRGWNVHVPDYPGSVAMDHFAKIVAERTQGRIRPRVFHSAQLGNQDVAIQQMQLGAIDFAVFNFIPLNNVVPETVAATLPFVFRSTEHLHKVMDGPIGADIGKAMEARNMVALAYYDSGSRSFYNSRKPIRTPEDMRGLKIRVQASDMYVALMAALGANATPIPFGEVFTALQSGVVDGAENNWPSYESTRHYEVAKHFTLNEHTMTPEVFAVARTTWARIQPADQAIVRAAALESAQMQRKLWAEREVSSRRKVEAAGAMIIDNVDKAPWIAAMKPVYERFGSSAQVKPLLDRILAER